MPASESSQKLSPALEEVVQRQLLSPMDPQCLIDMAQVLQDRPVEVVTRYGSSECGICQRGAVLAITEGKLTGSLRLIEETEALKRTVHVPAGVISDLLEVKPSLELVGNVR